MTAYYLVLSILTDLVMNDVPLKTFLQMKLVSLVYNFLTNYLFVDKFQTSNKAERVRQYTFYTVIFHGPLVGTIWLIAIDASWITVGIFFVTNLATAFLVGIWMNTLITSSKREFHKFISGKRIIMKKKKKSDETSLPPDEWVRHFFCANLPFYLLGIFEILAMK